MMMLDSIPNKNEKRISLIQSSFFNLEAFSIHFFGLINSMYLGFSSIILPIKTPRIIPGTSILTISIIDNY